MKFGEKFVEVRCRSGAGVLAVFESSSGNAEGNYIAWTATLLRPRTG